MVSVQEDTSGSKVFVFLLSHLSQCYKCRYINVLLGQVTCPSAVPTCPTTVPSPNLDMCGTARDSSGHVWDMSVVPEKRLHTNVYKPGTRGTLKKQTNLKLWRLKQCYIQKAHGLGLNKNSLSLRSIANTMLGRKLIMHLYYSDFSSS